MTTDRADRSAIVLRVWRTAVLPERTEEYHRFARERSLPMFESHDGFLGALFSRGDSDFATITIWRDAAAANALEASARYRETVSDILASGILGGDQTVERLRVDGGAVTAELPSLLTALAAP